MTTNPQPKRSMQRLAIAVLATLLCAAGTNVIAVGDKPERWRVLNPMTDPPSPIGGATIIVTYSGYPLSLGHSQRTCDRTEVVRADDQGWFYVPPPSRNRDASVTAHKLGHAYPGPQFLSNTERKEVYLIPNPTREQRMDQMNGLKGATGCRSAGPSAVAVASFLDDVLAEMRPLTTSKRDQDTIGSLEYLRARHRESARSDAR